MTCPLSRARTENHPDSNVRHFDQSFDQQRKLRRTLPQAAGPQG